MVIASLLGSQVSSQGRESVHLASGWNKNPSFQQGDLFILIMAEIILITFHSLQLVKEWLPVIVWDGHTLNYWHWTSKIDSSLLVTYIHLLGHRTPPAMQGHMGAALRNREPAGAMGGRLCRDKQVRWLLFLSVAWDWLPWMLCGLLERGIH